MRPSGEYGLSAQFTAHEGTQIALRYGISNTGPPSAGASLAGLSGGGRSPSQKSSASRTKRRVAQLCKWQLLRAEFFQKFGGGSTATFAVADVSPAPQVQTWEFALTLLTLRGAAYTFHQQVDLARPPLRDFTQAASPKGPTVCQLYVHLIVKSHPTLPLALITDPHNFLQVFEARAHNKKGSEEAASSQAIVFVRGT